MMRPPNGCTFCGATAPDPDSTPGRGYARLQEANPHLPGPRHVLRYELVGDADRDDLVITITMPVRMP